MDQYLQRRLETQGVEADDAMLVTLSQLLYSKRKMAFATDTRQEDRVLIARRGFADVYKVPLREVSEQTLRDSREGLMFWLDSWGPAGLAGDADPGVTVVSPGETACRIQRVLTDREQWLEQKGLPLDTQLNNTQRKLLMTHLAQEFAEGAGEKLRDEENRRQGYKDHEVKSKRRGRWNLEKQRRAGSSQVFELLLYTGRFDAAFLEAALEKISSSASERTESAT